LSYRVGLSPEKGREKRCSDIDDALSGRSKDEYLVANGEAVDGRGFRLTDDADDTVDRARGLAEGVEMEGNLGLLGSRDWGRLWVERSDEA
jgi:hypothetical protein